MNFTRVIWLAFFAVGLFLLGLAVVAVDGWALKTALPGYEVYCRGTFVADVPLSRTPLCFALWFTDAKSWIFFARDMLFQGQQGLYAQHMVRVADVVLFAGGASAFGLALACLWATAMTRVTQSTVAGWYSLMHGVAHFVAGRNLRDAA